MKTRCAGFHLAGGVAALLLSFDPSLAATRYRAIDLNHGEAYGSVVLAVGGGQASGFVIDSYQTGHATRYCRFAVHWDGLKAAPARLNVPGSSCSDVRGISGTRQVGATGHDLSRAVIWDDAANEARELDAGGFAYSAANGIHGDEIVGQAGGNATGGHLHAVLWQIGNSAVVDLNGPNHLESAALATNGHQEVGWASDGNGENVHAMMWSGTHRDEVDLNPNSFDSSYAYALSANSQVGVGLRGDSAHALLWHGSAAGAVDLNPAGFVESYATGVNWNTQVGYAIKPDLSAHAMVWSGREFGYIDLQKLLPRSLAQSYATSIDAEGDIGGYATEADGTPHAVVWRRIRTRPSFEEKVASNGR